MAHTPSRRRQAAIALLAIAIGVVVWLWGRSVGRNELSRLAPGPGASQGLTASAELDATVRMILRGRMRRHAAIAERLWESFLAADYQAIASHAVALSAEPQLHQPRPDESPELLNAEVPADFFAYQDDLGRAARELADAAAKRDPAGVTAAYHRVTTSCFTCHDRYRRGRASTAGQR